MSGSLRVLSSMATREVLLAAIVLYGREHPIRVDLESAGGVDVARRVSAGEATDVLVLASDAIDKLVRSGQLRSAGRRDLMLSEIAMGVRTGTVHPQASDEESLRNLVLHAPSLSYSTGPSGMYLERLFDRWGILDKIRPRIVVPPPGVPVARLIAAGHVSLGFQQLSELKNVSGVEVVGSLPAAIQHTTIFTAGISSVCNDVGEASRFLEFVASDVADAIKRRHGMTPI